jgi:hypothetical protein
VGWLMRNCPVVQNAGVGAWGPGLFSDDLACDVRADYRQLIEDGVADDEASSQILARYLSEPADPDEEPVVWLALAATQSKIGRLDPAVRDRAVGLIDSGTGLALWADDPRQLAKRRAVLEKVRAQLVGAQPARKKLRPPSRHVTDLRPGDVLGYRGANGRLALLRVARVEDSRWSVAPILVMLEFEGDKVPPNDMLEAVPDRAEPTRRSDGPRWSRTCFHVQAMRRVDYQAAGLHRAGTVRPRHSDDTVTASSYTSWHALARLVEFELTGQWPTNDPSTADSR